MTFRTELEAYYRKDYPMTDTCISHTHHAPSLSITEKKLETEALSLIFELSMFHKYVSRMDLMLQKDNLPLIGLLNEDRVTSALASARIYIWALTVSNYISNQSR